MSPSRRALLYGAVTALALSWAHAGSVDALLERARSEISSHRLVEARLTVRSILRKAPVHPEANAMLCGLMVTDADALATAGGREKSVNKKWNEAAAQCGRAAAVNTGEATEGSLQRLRLRALLRVKAWDDAAATFETLIAASPGDGRYVGGYAASLDWAGRGDEGRAALQAASGRGPDFDRAARFEFIWDRFDPADHARLRDMITSLKTEDTDPQHLAVLAVLETALGDGYMNALLGFLDLVDRGILSRPELEKLWTTISSPREGVNDAQAEKLDFADLELPTMLHQVDPIYPRSAVDRRISGKVIVLARINLDGTVNPAWIIQITDPVFAEASLRSVLARRYTPAKQKGEPIAFPFTIRVDFRIR
jgi:TonB family protein